MQNQPQQNPRSNSLYFKLTPISFFFFNSLIQCNSLLFLATTPLADVNFDSWLFCSWVFIIWALIIFWPPFWAFDFQDWVEEFGSFSISDVGQIWILFCFRCWTNLDPFPFLMLDDFSSMKNSNLIFFKFQFYLIDMG